MANDYCSDLSNTAQTIFVHLCTDCPSGPDPACKASHAARVLDIKNAFGLDDGGTSDPDQACATFNCGGDVTICITCKPGWTPEQCAKALEADVQKAKEVLGC